MNLFSIIKSLFNKKPGTENHHSCVLMSHFIKVCFIVIAGILILLSLCACTANEQSAENDPKSELEELYGYYEFNENVYTNPLSSFLPFKGHMPFYEISESGLSIISIQDGSVQKIPGAFEKKPLDREEFKKMFSFTFLVPDVEQYESCFEAAVFSAENGSKYRLYVMDHRIWLVFFHTKGSIWSIYGLCRIEDFKTDPDGRLIVPTEAPYEYQEGFQLEICSGKSVLDSAFVCDEKSMKVLEELIELYDTQAVRAGNAEIFDIGDYLRFYNADGKDNTLYYAFLNQEIAEQPQMQTNKESTRSEIPAENYEALYQLWENLMPLPDNITVISGEQSISAILFRQHDDIDLESLKGYLPWLTVQSDGFDPFRVYREGEELFGWYEVYDAETMEALDFVRPSGLKPQTYLFQNTNSGQSYIVVMSSGYSTGTNTYGMKIIFGAALP